MKYAMDRVLTFLGPCIVIYFYSITNQMHLFLILFILYYIEFYLQCVLHFTTTYIQTHQ
jgi:hypothetical protein